MPEQDPPSKGSLHPTSDHDHHSRREEPKREEGEAQDSNGFGKWQSILWPVHYHELKKLVPMLLIFFLLSFNYNILRSVKEVNIISASCGGAEVLPFIKVWVMLPAAFTLTYIFNRISELSSREYTFYIMIGIFLTFYIFFTFILYPQKEAVELTSFAAFLERHLPSGMRGFIAMIQFWSFTTFYVMCELWGTAILMVAFWGFANEVTRIEEAKRFYALFGIGANLSGVASSTIFDYCSRFEFNPRIPYGTEQWDQTQLIVMMTVILTSITSVALFRWLNSNVLKDPRYAPVEHAPPKRKHAGRKGSFLRDLRYLFDSPYMLSIAVIVLSYGFVINSVEMLWKEHVRMLYPNRIEYAVYMNKVTFIIGVISTFIALFVTGNAIRFSGWTFAANVTPIIFLLSSIGFFTPILFPEVLQGGWFSLVFVTPLAGTVFFGSLQNCLSRACKYTFFDATKELAFVPLDRQTKLKGKSSVDGVVSRLGKSGASVLYNILIPICGTMPACAPFFSAFIAIVIALWLLAIRYVGFNFQILTQEKAPTKTESFL